MRAAIPTRTAMTIKTRTIMKAGWVRTALEAAEKTCFRTLVEGKKLPMPNLIASTKLNKCKVKHS